MITFLVADIHMSNLVEKIEQSRELLKDKPKGTEILVSLNTYDLRQINMALRLWNYGNTILDEELDLVHR